MTRSVRVAAIGLFLAGYVGVSGADAQDPQAGGGSTPPPASQTELVFEREVFQYPSFIRGNPFLPLDAGNTGPRFEQLSLIGVMHSDDPTASVAVLSTGGVSVQPDGTITPVAGDAFYVKAGQRVGNVTIVEIHPERVLVDVEEFGLMDRRTLVFQSRREGGS